MKIAHTLILAVLAFSPARSFADSCTEDSVNLDSTAYLGAVTHRVSSIYRRCTPIAVSYPQMSQQNCGLVVLSLGSRKVLEDFVAQIHIETNPGQTLRRSVIRSFSDRTGSQTYFVSYDITPFYGTYVFQSRLQTKTGATLHDLAKSIGGDLYLRSVSCDELATGRF